MTQPASAQLHENRLDWNELWRAEVVRKWPDLDQRAEYWNRRAATFAKDHPLSPYTRILLDILAPEPHWSVLDVGCGTGTLAIPLAQRVARVTAMDFSSAMIERLLRRSSDLGLQNLQALHAGWEDDWDRLSIGTHDVAIASRSLVVEDLEAALRKLDRSARHRVYITSTVGDGPLDRRAMEALGRTFHQGPDYIYVYNLLHQMGIYANITILDTGEERTFRSPEEALAFYRVFIGELSAEEDARLRAYLPEQLVPRNGVWALRNQNPLQWALIWWEKGAA